MLNELYARRGIYCKLVKAHSSSNFFTILIGFESDMRKTGSSRKLEPLFHYGKEIWACRPTKGQSQTGMLCDHAAALPPFRFVEYAAGEARSLILFSNKHYKRKKGQRRFPKGERKACQSGSDLWSRRSAKPLLDNCI